MKRDKEFKRKRGEKGWGATGRMRMTRGRGMQRKEEGRREWQRAEVMKKEWEGKLRKKEIGEDVV